MDEVTAALKEQDIEELAAAGGWPFCCEICITTQRHIHTARYVFDLAFDNIIKVVTVSHVPALTLPYKYKETRVPVIIDSCETNAVLSSEVQGQADATLGRCLPQNGPVQA